MHTISNIHSTRDVLKKAVRIISSYLIPTDQILTTRDLEVIEAIITIGKGCLDEHSRINISDHLKMSRQNLNNYVKKLKDLKLADKRNLHDDFKGLVNVLENEDIVINTTLSLNEE